MPFTDRPILYSLIAAVAMANAVLILRLAMAMISFRSDRKSRNI